MHSWLGSSFVTPHRLENATTQDKWVDDLVRQETIHAVTLGEDEEGTHRYGALKSMLSNQLSILFTDEESATAYFGKNIRQRIRGIQEDCDSDEEREFFERKRQGVYT